MGQLTVEEPRRIGEVTSVSEIKLPEKLPEETPPLADVLEDRPHSPGTIWHTAAFAHDHDFADHVIGKDWIDGLAHRVPNGSPKASEGHESPEAG